MVLVKPLAYGLFLRGNALDGLVVLEPLNESNPVAEEVSGKHISLVPAGLSCHISAHCLEFSICSSLGWL